MFKNKILLITGGTGSFGKAVLDRFLNSELLEIRIFSRDEKKQDDMRRKYNNKKLKFYIGDVRDSASLRLALRNVDYVFHAAALKQVPSCEFYPLEAVKTNVLGTENLLQMSIELGIKKVICLSTDKAVYPINAMGISKAMMERIAISKSNESQKTIICITRYGNVLASRGSVIPLFLKLIQNNKKLTITNPNMTRFIMTLEDAVNLVMFAFQNGVSGDIFVQKSPATTVMIMAKALCEILEKKDYPINIIGTRHGEKRYESLLSNEEMASAEDLNNYFRIPADLRDLNYEKYYDTGEESITIAGKYNSDNAEQLDIKAMKDLLNKIKFIQAATKGKIIDPEE